MAKIVALWSSRSPRLPVSHVLSCALAQHCTVPETFLIETIKYRVIPGRGGVSTMPTTSSEHNGSQSPLNVHRRAIVYDSVPRAGQRVSVPPALEDMEMKAPLYRLRERRTPSYLLGKVCRIAVVAYYVLLIACKVIYRPILSYHTAYSHSDGDDADHEVGGRPAERLKPCAWIDHRLPNNHTSRLQTLVGDDVSGGVGQNGDRPKRKVSKRGGTCTAKGCVKKSRGSTGRCRRHGGGVNCKIPGCTGFSRLDGKCSVHGGAQMCIVPECDKRARFFGRCTRHGGFVNCRMEGCELRAVTKGVCAKHGGKSACRHPGCMRSGLKSRHGWCQGHGRIFDHFRLHHAREVERGLQQVACTHVDPRRGSRCVETALTSRGLPLYCPAHLILAHCGAGIGCKAPCHAKGRCARHLREGADGTETQRPVCSSTAVGEDREGLSEKFQGWITINNHSSSASCMKYPVAAGGCSIHPQTAAEMEGVANLVGGEEPAAGQSQALWQHDDQAGVKEGGQGALERISLETPRAQESGPSTGTFAGSPMPVSDLLSTGVWAAPEPEGLACLVLEEHVVTEGMDSREWCEDMDHRNGRSERAESDTGDAELKGGRVRGNVAANGDLVKREHFDAESFFFSESRHAQVVGAKDEERLEATSSLYFGGISRCTPLYAPCPSTST